MIRKKAIVIFLLAGVMLFAHGLSRAQDASIPGLDQTFSPEEEKNIDGLTGEDIPDVFTSLGSAAFFEDADYLNKAIYMAFNHRSTEAVQFALGIVGSAQGQTSPTVAKNFYIAKKTLQIFPDQSLDRLLDLYLSSGATARKNIIEVLGQMDGGQSIGTLLINALDDKSICEEVRLESVGEPLRICDVAYNQLALRYQFKDIPRVIGSIHSIDMRDQNIQLLKKMIAGCTQGNP